MVYAVPMKEFEYISIYQRAEAWLNRIYCYAMLKRHITYNQAGWFLPKFLANYLLVTDISLI